MTWRELGGFAGHVAQEVESTNVLVAKTEEPYVGFGDVGCVSKNARSGASEIS